MRTSPFDTSPRACIGALKCLSSGSPEAWCGLGVGILSALGARRSALGARRSALGARRSALGARRSALGARRSALGARRSALGARRSALGARRSALGARRSALGDIGARRSALGARRSALGARRSALGARRSALGARRSALGALLIASSEFAPDVPSCEVCEVRTAARDCAAAGARPSPSCRFMRIDIRPFGVSEWHIFDQYDHMINRNIQIPAPSAAHRQPARAGNDVEAGS